MFHLNLEGLLIVLAIVIILFGGSKIPELMRSIGKGAGEYRKGLDETKRPPGEADSESDRPT